MPKNEQGEVKCLNNPDHKMEKELSTYSITRIQKDEDKDTRKIMLGEGFEFDVHVCKECGYIEFYDPK